VSCGGPYKPQKATDETFNQVVAVMLDSTTTWKDVIKVMTPWRAIISKGLADTTSLECRLRSQYMAYEASRYGVHKFYELKGAGVPLTDKEWYEAFGDLREQIHGWFYNSQSKATYLWRDHLEVTGKHQDDPTKSFLHFNVSIPSDTVSTALFVLFPDGFVRRPVLLFSETEFDEEMNEDNVVYVQFEDMTEEGEFGDNPKRWAWVGEEAVEKMLKYPVMYILYYTKGQEEGDPDEFEDTRLMLKPFQDLWNKTVGVPIDCED
ncbi:MAG: hypothetical protein IKO04_06185, partial [Bacteroidales bacterium]|nr:hypothetical protein [Bacteroidales bacterium]